MAADAGLTAAKTLCERGHERMASQQGRMAEYNQFLFEYFQHADESDTNTPLANYSDGRPALRAPGEGESGRSDRRGSVNFIKPIIKDLVSVRGGWPTTTVPPASGDDADQKNAVLITRALRQQHEHSAMIRQQQRAGFFLSCLGDTVYTLDPRLPSMVKADPDPFKPVGIYYNVVNPKHAFPRFRDANSGDLESLFVINWLPMEEAEEQYPGMRFADREDPWIEVMHYYSRTERQTIVDGTRFTGIVHNLGFCPAEWVCNEATDGRFAQSDISGTIELHRDVQALWSALEDSFVGSVFPIYVIHDAEQTQGQLEYGPGAQFTTTGTGNVTVLAPQSNPQAAQLIFDTARQNLMQQTGVAPVRIEGQIDKSNTSARSVDRQQAPMEQRLKLSLGLLTEGLQRLNAKCLLMLSNIPEFQEAPMDLYGRDTNGSYHETFTGSDIGGWTKNIVKWDAMLGTTQQERSVASLQLYKEGQGDYPFSAVLEANGDEDPQATMARGRAEAEQRMKFQQSMQPPAPPGGGPGGPQGPPGGAGGSPTSAAEQAMSLAGGGQGGPPGGAPPPVQPPPPNGAAGGGMPGFGPVDAAPTQPGLGSPAPVPDIAQTIRQVLATLSLRGTADLEISKRGYVVQVTEYRDIPAVKQALRPVAEQFGVSIKVEAASAARSQ